MWPNRKIPYTFHWTIEEVPTRKALVQQAIRNIEEESCLVFEDITDYMKKYLQDYEKFRNVRDFFTKYKNEPTKYPDYIL